MATLTIKNVPDRLYGRLKKRAAAHRRSINSEAIVCLERVLASERRDPRAILADIRAFRKTLGNVYVTDEFLDAAKREGRL